MQTNKKISYITKIAILSALACILMLFDIPLPFIAPSFYQIDFSEVIVLIGSFSMGPVAGVLIELIKILLNLLLKGGSSTAYVGEFANFVTGCAYILPAAIIYRMKKNRSHAVIGMLVGTFSLAFVGGLMNYFVMIPLYAKLYMPMETILGMAASIFPVIDSLWKMILLCVVPFNLIKGTLCAILTFLLYKRLSVLLKK